MNMEAISGVVRRVGQVTVNGFSVTRNGVSSAAARLVGQISELHAGIRTSGQVKQINKWLTHSTRVSIEGLQPRARAVVGMALGHLDTLYSRHLQSRDKRFFSRGWGEHIATYEGLTDCMSFIADKPMAMKGFELTSQRILKKGKLSLLVREGRFLSPLAAIAPHLLPAESHYSRFLMVTPVKSGPNSDFVTEASPSEMPMCLHLAATGDVGYARRLAIAVPLARSGIGSIIIENPFYGSRKPQDQYRYYIEHLQDLLTMCHGVIEESRSLLVWLRNRGHEKLGITGISMGGNVTALLSTVAPFPLAVVPCISGHSAAPVFCEGVLTQRCAWDTLDAATAATDRQAEKSPIVLGGIVKDLEDKPIPQDRLERMRRILEVSRVTNFPRYNGHSVIQVSATHDQYIPKWSSRLLANHLQSELRWVTGGHISAILTAQDQIVTAVEDAFDRLKP